MNLKSKILVNVITVAASALGLAASALAGEGGVAGSASFQLDPTTGNVQNAAVAAAVGKDSAYAGANNYPGFQLDAFAVGTGGDITTNGFTNYIQSVGPDVNRGISQANNLGGLVDIDATSGTTIVTP
ncbi:MAG TPA: hypothetical protein V6D33_04235 [Cyanophyceae cyanobacterium]